jgi:acyl carrier protein
MSLPQSVLDTLNENARQAGVAAPGRGDDLFKAGVLDSFTLVDFVSVIEEECGVKVPDADVKPENFRTVEAIESYVAARGGRG